MGKHVRRLVQVVRAVVVGAWAAVAGAFGTGGHVIADRKSMYGDDPKNDPYSIEYDPKSSGGKRRPD